MFTELSLASRKSPARRRQQSRESLSEYSKFERPRSRSPVFGFLESSGESEHTKHSESRSSSGFPKGSRRPVFSVQIGRPAHSVLPEARRKVISAPPGKPEHSESVPSYGYFGSPGRPIYFNDHDPQPPSPPLGSETSPDEAISSTADPPYYLFDLNKPPR